MYNKEVKGRKGEEKMIEKERIPVPEINDLDLAFGASTKHLPPMEEIPEEFKNFRGNPYVKATSNWFFEGISTDILIPREGVDKNKALKALSSILRSFEPKHEHKTAGVAYLMSEWFELKEGWDDN